MPLTLSLLRRLTQHGYRHRGAARICEKIRCFYINRPRALMVTDFDRDLALNVDLSEHIESQIFWRGYYSWDQLQVLGSLLKADDVFFDIGANIGEFTLYCAKRLTGGEVYSFEPVGALHRRLATNVALNGLANVRLLKLALAEAEGEMDIYASNRAGTDGSRNAGLPTLYGDAENGVVESVSVTSLDRFVSEQRLDQIDFIKMDIEGAELSALRGGARTLERFRPTIIIEVNDATCRRAGYDGDEILGFLGSLGYAFRRIGRNGALLDCDRSSLSEFQNLLCLPDGGA